MEAEEPVAALDRDAYAAEHVYQRIDLPTLPLFATLAEVVTPAMRFNAVQQEVLLGNDSTAVRSRQGIVADSTGQRALFLRSNSGSMASSEPGHGLRTHSPYA